MVGVSNSLIGQPHGEARRFQQGFVFGGLAAAAFLATLLIPLSCCSMAFHRGQRSECSPLPPPPSGFWTSPGSLLP